MVGIRHAVRTDFHNRAVLGTAAGTAIKPDDSALAIRNMFVLEMPEEEIAVGLGGDLDVTSAHTGQSVSRLKKSWGIGFVFKGQGTYPACILTKSPSGAPGSE